ncbi:hypothetical protein DSAG12_00233 [Promethearchaeum syntrophicum]|uniref:Uncharacterized protein n=1 Tax=Promethearchaeum syntrophicum TaxID=2594042 RepID=A0A5B9D6F7_9ARCH|nr:hypothetical protein [Candidatus Prometheoarchaeum syntrophicum]QEE14420.1 hypothetical protein DSAG12_00233 [Candidatus Prometheoarchaeum syntrophicum]
MSGFTTAEIKKDHDIKNNSKEDLISKKKIRLKELEKKLNQIEKAENSESIIHSEKEQLLSELIELFLEEKGKAHILSTIINCRKIIKLATDLEKPHLSDKFCNYLQEYEQNLLDSNSKEEEEYHSVQTLIGELKEIINVEENVAPEIEHIPIEDLIGEIDSDLINMEDLANQVLEEHAVEIKESIKSRSVLRHQSGKATENHREIDIELHIENPGDLSSKEYVVINTIENSSEDPIEAAFIQDIIPYNYEISEITLNGKIPEVESNERMMKNGLEHSWYVPNIEKDDSIEFKYHLKPRISRTIVLPLKDKLTIIKTHSSIKEGKEKGKNKKIDDSSVFDAFLKFVNSFDTLLNDVVLEDIIPIFYAYEVEERKTKDFPSIKESSETFVKWRLNEMPPEQYSIAEYELIELNKLEELKIEAHKILQQDPSKLSIFKRRNLKKRQKRAQEFLEKMRLI